MVKFDSRQERGAVLPGGDSRNHGYRAPPEVSGLSAPDSLCLILIFFFCLFLGGEFEKSRVLLGKHFVSHTGNCNQQRMSEDKGSFQFSGSGDCHDGTSRFPFFFH